MIIPLVVTTPGIHGDSDDDQYSIEDYIETYVPVTLLGQVSARSSAGAGNRTTAALPQRPALRRPVRPVTRSHNWNAVPVEIRGDK